MTITLDDFTKDLNVTICPCGCHKSAEPCICMSCICDHVKRPFWKNLKEKESRQRKRKE